MKQNDLVSRKIMGARKLGRLMRLAAILGAAAVLSGFVSAAGGAIILGNLPASNEQPGADMGFGTQVAVKFTMGSSSQVLDNVILRIKTNASGSNIPSI